MRNQVKREEIPEALKNGVLQIMATWSRGDVKGIAKAVNDHRALLNRIEDMIKQDLWNEASGK